MSVKKEHWLVWLAVKTWYDAGRKDLSAERLLEILFLLDQEFKKRSGRHILDFEFVAWLNGLYSYEFYKALEEAADVGLIEYVVEVEIPDDLHDGDEDVRSALVKHELDRVDVERVRRIVKPLADVAEPPPDLLRLLEEVGATLGDLTVIIMRIIDSEVELAETLKAIEIGRRV